MSSFKRFRGTLSQRSRLLGLYSHSHLSQYAMNRAYHFRVSQVAGSRFAESQFASYASGAIGEHHDAVSQLSSLLYVMCNECNRSRTLAQQSGKLLPHTQPSQIVE